MNLNSILGNESRFGRAMTKCGTIIAINLLFVISCIPFVTAGAACAAMYHAIFEMIRADEPDSGRSPVNPFKVYFEGFRRHFLRATLSFLGFVSVMAAGWADLTICRQAGGFLRVMSAGVIAVMITAAVIAVYFFPLMTQMGGKVTDLIRLCVYAAMSRPHVTLLGLVLNGALPALLVLDEVNRPAYVFAAAFSAFGLIAWIIGKLLHGQIRMLQDNYGGNRSVLHAEVQ